MHKFRAVFTSIAGTEYERFVDPGDLAAATRDPWCCRYVGIDSGASQWRSINDAITTAAALARSKGFAEQCAAISKAAEEQESASTLDIRK